MESKLPHKREKGQVGIGTLIVFIAMVLVAAIAAGVLINTAGFLQSQSEQTGQASTAQVSDRIQVVNVVGDQIDSEPGVEIINMTVKKAPGANDIDLVTVTAQFITEGQVVNLIHAESKEAQDADTGSTYFNTTAIQDQNDNSITDSNVLNDAADRAKITFDIGTDDTNLADTGAVNALTEGQKATIQLTTQAGGETTVTITTPDSLSGKTAVRL